MEIETHNELEAKAFETKSGAPLDAMMTHAEMMRAFEAFKKTNDQRLALDSGRDGDDEKLARNNAAMDAQAKRLDEISGIAWVCTISGNVYKKPFMTAGPAVGWIGETDARTQTTSPTLDELSFPAMDRCCQADEVRGELRRGANRILFRQGRRGRFAPALTP